MPLVGATVIYVVVNPRKINAIFVLYVPSDGRDCALDRGVVILRVTRHHPLIWVPFSKLYLLSPGKCLFSTHATLHLLGSAATAPSFNKNSRKYEFTPLTRTEIITELYGAFWGSHANHFVSNSSANLPFHISLHELQHRLGFGGAGKERKPTPGRACGNIFRKGECYVRCGDYAWDDSSPPSSGQLERKPKTYRPRPQTSAFCGSYDERSILFCPLGRRETLLRRRDHFRTREEAIDTTVVIGGREREVRVDMRANFARLLETARTFSQIDLGVTVPRAYDTFRERISVVIHN
ncbi:hypothetical protein BJ322DRAFT_519836 [Thelephora terrestris]|uniref:Uncharacterized protein n=1 Tax=Thelephora terrestris TaxID=56493 RepID=A0A9P6H553_9AGAM|nr:hypothetical protein BJ322DRAFT_519836 [Thelephora terrestris]